MLIEKIKLESDEQILVETRRHWFVLVIDLSTFLLGAVLPALFLLLASSYLEQYFNLSLSSYPAEIAYLYALWLLFLWFGAFSVWTNYYLDVLIVTDRRLVLINQRGFFRRMVGSFRLERMQDLNVEINGLVATLLNYGTVHVETASDAEEEFRATYLPRPRELKSIILKAADTRIKKLDTRVATNDV